MPPEPAARGRQRLDQLWRAGTEFLGCPLALMGGAMTWVSERHLVASID
jgi:enoyl-[acyl-carrier protein] reductase II